MKKQIIFETPFNTYTADSILGQGGAGIVYSVRDTSNQVFALKRLKPESISTERLKRFKNEIFFCERNSHPNIITVVDAGFYKIDTAKCPFYVMPLHDKTLRDLMVKGIKPEQVPSFFIQILDGIEAAHLKGVWHRDLKPENILFDSTNNRLVLTDFGIAHFSEEELKTLVETNENSKLANFQYAAPEQKIKKGKIDYRADIYALGLMLNELFTKKVPQGTNWTKVESVALDFSYLDPIIDKMLHQDPDHRYESIDKLKVDIEVNRKMHIVRQGLSKISKEVVPLPKANDLFVTNPVEINGIDYKNETLEIQLNQSINQEWLDAFRTLPGCAFLMNYEPERFQFHGDKASIRVMKYTDQSTIQQIVSQFKTWLIQTTNHLRNLRETNSVKNHREEMARLEEEKRAEKRRLEIISNTKF